MTVRREQLEAELELAEVEQVLEARAAALVAGRLAYAKELAAGAGQRAAHLAQARAYEWTLVLRGVCCNCRRRPATPGARRCEPCADKNRITNREKYRARKGAVRTHRCQRCGQAGHYARTCSAESEAATC